MVSITLFNNDINCSICINDHQTIFNVKINLFSLDDLIYYYKDY